MGKWRNGVKKKKKSGTRTTKPTEAHTAKQWHQNKAKDSWHRWDKQDTSEHPFHKAKQVQSKRRFLSKKGKKNFGRLLQNALENRPKPKPDPKRPRHSPFNPRSSKATRPKIYGDEPTSSETDPRSIRDHLKTIEQLIGTPKYFAFIAQEDLSAEVVALAKRFQEEYKDGKEWQKKGKGRPKSRDFLIFY